MKRKYVAVFVSGVILLVCGPSAAVAQQLSSFAVLGGSTVTNTGPTIVTGNLGVSPGSALTGFPPGIVVGGSIHVADAVAAQAQTDLTTLYNRLAGTMCNTDLTGQNLGGLTLTPGVYCFASSAQLTGTLTLDAQGHSNAVFIFKIGSTLTTASGSSVMLINNASSCGVSWLVGSSATLGTGASLPGSIVALTSITLNTSASVSGRVLARSGAVTLDSNHVTVCSSGLGLSPPTISKAFGAPSILLNAATSLSFTIANPNVGPSLSGVGFTDALPAGLVVATPNGLTGSCGGGSITATAGSSSVSLLGASLASSASCTFSVNVKGTTLGMKNNVTSNVTSNEAGPGNTASASLTVLSSTLVPAIISKAFGAPTILLNGITNLSFTITNPNVSVSLSGVGFTDTLPAGLIVATPNGVTGSCGGGGITATAGSASVSLLGASLAAGAFCTFAVNVTGTTVGLKNNVTTNVTSNEAGPGNAASASITVLSSTTGPIATPTMSLPALAGLALLLAVLGSVLARKNRAT
jgi:hypothetical protein